MSAETSKPGTPVHDGVQNDADPVPKEPDGSAAGGNGPSDTPAVIPEPGAGASPDADFGDPTGPAEENDRASADDRGLTTKVAPSD